MSKAVSYWTGIWEPSREALSKETDILRRAICPGADVVSFSAGQRSGWQPGTGVVRLAGRRWLVLRALAPVLERRARVTHVLGEIDAWHLLRAVGRRPVLFTVAIDGTPLRDGVYERVSVFVAESEALVSRLHRAGVPGHRVRLIYPGVDLTRFRPVTRSADHFTVLFASSPARAEDFSARGLDLIVEAARQCPDMQFALLWRQWDDAAQTAAAFDILRPPPNVQVIRRDVADVAEVYQGAHVTILLNAPGYGKSCPNSVVEGLACGCPTVVADSCGIAPLVTRAGAGAAVCRTVASVTAALRQLQRTWFERSTASRLLAERHFNIENFIGSYRALYAELGAAR